MRRFFKKRKQEKETHQVDLTEGLGKTKNIKLHCPSCGIFISDKTPEHGVLMCTCGSLVQIANFKAVTG